MTVSTETNTAGPYVGDGKTKQFAIEFPFLNADDLKTLLTNNDGETELLLKHDYEVRKSPQGDSFIQLTQALPVGSQLMVARNTPFTQTAQYVQGDAFTAPSHEQAVDKLTMLFQELQTDATRTIETSAEEEKDIQFPAAEDRKNKISGFDEKSALQTISIGNGVNLEKDLIRLKDGVGMLSTAQGISVLYGNGIDVYDKAIVIKKGSGLAFDEQSRLEIEETLLKTIQNSSVGLIDLQGLVKHLEKRILDLEIEGGGEVTIFIGDGLHYDPNGDLTIKPHTGISVTAEGVSVRIGNGLEIDPSGNIKISEALQKEIAEKAEKSNLPKPEDWAGEGLEAKDDKLSVAKPEDRFTIIYPNGGTEANPALIKPLSRIIMENPFGDHFIKCEAEVYVQGMGWGATGFIFHSGGNVGLGVGAYQLFHDEGNNIVVTSGSSVISNAWNTGGPILLPKSAPLNEAPCRVKVWRID